MIPKWLLGFLITLVAVLAALWLYNGYLNKPKTTTTATATTATTTSKVLTEAEKVDQLLNEGGM